MSVERSSAISRTSLCRSDGSGRPLDLAQCLEPEMMTSPPSTEQSGLRVTAECVVEGPGLCRLAFAGIIGSYPQLLLRLNPELMRLIQFLYNHHATIHFFL